MDVHFGTAQAAVASLLCPRLVGVLLHPAGDVPDQAWTVLSGGGPIGLVTNLDRHTVGRTVRPRDADQLRGPAWRQLPGKAQHIPGGDRRSRLHRWCARQPFRTREGGGVGDRAVAGPAVAGDRRRCAGAGCCARRGPERGGARLGSRSGPRWSPGAGADDRDGRLRTCASARCRRSSRPVESPVHSLSRRLARESGSPRSVARAFLLPRGRRDARRRRGGRVLRAQKLCRPVGRRRQTATSSALGGG